MRKFTLILIAFVGLVSSAAFAQFPDAGSKAFAFSINGLNGSSSGAGHTGTLLLKYYQTDNFIWRVSAAVTYGNSGSSNIGSGRTTTSTYTDLSISAGLGFEKIIAKVNRFAIYTGADIVPMLGTSNSTNYSVVTDSTMAGGYNGDFSKDVTKTPRNFSLTLDPFLGFNYFISKNFSLGLEFGPGISYSFPGTGNQTTSGRNQGITEPTLSTPYYKTQASWSITSTNATIITGAVYF